MSVATAATVATAVSQKPKVTKVAAAKAIAAAKAVAVVEAPAEDAEDANDASPRDRVREMCKARCATLDDDLIADLEIGILNWSLQQADAFRVPKTWASPKFAAIYGAKARSVLMNLDRASYIGNAGLLDRLVARELKPHEVPFMKPQDTFPERWREVVDLKVQKDEYAATVKPVAMTDQFRCKRCKKRECVYQELQLRSADEPATIIITCISCSNTWRIG